MPYKHEVNHIKLVGLQDRRRKLTEEQKTEIIRLRDAADGLIDVFEELLDRLDITLPDKWREGEEDEARIFGDTYYELENKIVERLRKEVR